jgi:excisionase family DNA binding protein
VATLIVLTIDRDVAGHLAVALHRHRDALRKNGLAEPEALAQLERASLEVVKSTQQTSDGVSALSGLDDDGHERKYLSRSDISRIASVSLATVDRWIRSGELRSRRRGRTRRVARADLERFLAA